MRDSERAARGMSLIEVLIAMMLLSILALAAAPMFYQATQASAAGADLGTVGALAVERMETLRAQAFASLADGGSLTSNVPGYYDDANPDAIVRWQISTDSTGRLKTIRVRATALREVAGREKQVTLTSLRSR